MLQLEAVIQTAESRRVLQIISIDCRSLALKVRRIYWAIHLYICHQLGGVHVKQSVVVHIIVQIALSLTVEFPLLLIQSVFVATC